jgi:hypothetical protein
MKQKKYNDKKRNTINLKNKRTASSTAYKPLKPGTKDYQKSNYDNQTDNKENDRNTDMSMGLEDKKKKTKTMDQKEEKPFSPKEAVTTTTSSQLAPPESEVFDSSSDNAMSEMKKAADMGPDETSKVFSHVEEKQQLDPSTASINDSIKKTDPSPTTFPAMVEPTLQEREDDSMESIEDVMVPRHDVESDIAHIQNASEEQGRLDESVTVYDNGNKVSNSNLSNYDIYNPYIIGIKFWQAHNIAWINAYNEFLKAWIDNIRRTASTYEEFNSNRNRMLKITEI